MSRINIQGSTMDAMISLADGNPGACRVLAEVMQQAEKIDPDNALGALGILFDFDERGIYGPDIWVLYKDVCGLSIVKVLALLRAVQLGFLPPTTVEGCDRRRGAAGCGRPAQTGPGLHPCLRAGDGVSVLPRPPIPRHGIGGMYGRGRVHPGRTRRLPDRTGATSARSSG